MFRLLTYLSFAVFIVIVASCSHQQNGVENKEANTDVDYKKQSRHVNIINHKGTNSITPTNTNPGASFLYQAKITKNVGSSVNRAINEIAPLTANIPQKKPHFNIDRNDGIHHVNKPPTIVNIVFDNDIFDNTDYYYTNGVNIELITPLAAQSPLSGFLVGLPKPRINLYGFSIKQNIYTPVNPDIAEISVGDRPFSAFLTMGQFRHSYNLQKRISMKSSLSFGVLGPASMGGIVQSSIHDIEPIGWDNQIRNNIVVDYSVMIEKGVVSTPHVELNVTAGGNLGTIFNKLNGGLYLRAGSFVPVFKGPATIHDPTTKGTFQYWFFVSGKANVVFYDATLQGGMFNKENPYVIQGNDINRFVANLSVGFAMYYKKAGVELQNFYLSPEFKNAYDFRWGRIKLVYQF